MVKAIVNISYEANRLFNIVKAKHGLKDKSEAINLVAEEYAGEMLEPELRPEFVERMLKVRKEKGIPFKNVADLRRQIKG